MPVKQNFISRNHFFYLKTLLTSPTSKKYITIEFYLNVGGALQTYPFCGRSVINTLFVWAEFHKHFLFVGGAF